MPPPPPHTHVLNLHLRVKKVVPDVSIKNENIMHLNIHCILPFAFFFFCFSMSDPSFLKFLDPPMDLYIFIRLRKNPSPLAVFVRRMPVFIASFKINVYLLGLWCTCRSAADASTAQILWSVISFRFGRKFSFTATRQRSGKTGICDRKMIQFMPAKDSNTNCIITILIHSAKTRFENVIVMLLLRIAKDVTSSFLSWHKRYDFNAANFRRQSQWKRA